MSFSQSDLYIGVSQTSLSGSYGISCSYDGDFGYLFYSIDSGATWNQTLSPPKVSFRSIALSNNYGLAAGIDFNTYTGVIYYTIDGGANWSDSVGLPTTTLDTNNPILISISGTSAVAVLGSNTSSVSLFYSTDGGANWSQTTNMIGAANIPFDIADRTILDLDNSGNNVIFCCFDSSGTSYAYNSTDGGINVYNTPFTVTNSNFNAGAISGDNAIIVGSNVSGGFIFTSGNKGVSWNTSVIGLTNTIFYNAVIEGLNSFVGGIYTSGTDTGIIYSTTNFGGNNQTSWNIVSLSGPSFNTFTSIDISGLNGIASLNSFGNGYIYYTTNGGVTWTQSIQLLFVYINDVNIYGNNGISGTDGGVYYTSTPFCYEKNTLILVFENNKEIYKKVSELKVGDLVKTYKHGYKKIKLLRSFKYKPLNKNSDLHYLYKMKDHDVILTGGHSILVDELTEQEKLNNIKYLNWNDTLEDKKLVLACSSDKFEKIEDDLEYELYHFSLENRNKSKHYGVYINDGILSESCSEKVMLKML